MVLELGLFRHISGLLSEFENWQLQSEYESAYVFKVTARHAITLGVLSTKDLTGTSVLKHHFSKRKRPGAFLLRLYTHTLGLLLHFR